MDMLRTRTSRREDPILSIGFPGATYDRIVCVARRPEHPIRNGPQVRPVLFELLGEPFTAGQSVTFLRRGPSW
jgi:hypothetical protein